MEKAVLPKVVEEVLIRVRDRVRDIVKQYGSLARYGLPVLHSREELAAIVYASEISGLKELGVSKWLGLDKTTVYKWVKKVREGNPIQIYDPEEHSVKTVTLTVEEAKAIIEEALRPSAKRHLHDIMQSAAIQEFLQNPVKRSVIAGKPRKLSQARIRLVLNAVQKVADYIKANMPHYPSNPDLWEENVVEEVLWKLYGTYEKVAEAMVLIRAIPRFSTWFRGRIGAATKRRKIVDRAIFYEHYLKLKQLYRQGKLDEPEWLIPALHIAVGCREGWHYARDSQSLEDQTVEAEGRTIPMPSLLGLRWEKVTWLPDGGMVLRVYESKTEKEWSCDPSWLDEEIVARLRTYARDRGSILNSILTKTYGGHWTVGRFRRWYEGVLEKISELLGLPFRLTPHDMRRSHISILAELQVPMEYALSGQLDFGVGWEDAKTALVYYLRFSKMTKKLIMDKIQEVKKVIEASST